MTYDQLEPEDDGWSKWHFFPRFWKHACCFCSEIHEVKMKVDKRGKIWMKWRTDKRASSAMRRKKK